VVPVRDGAGSAGEQAEIIIAIVHRNTKYLFMVFLLLAEY
jgi:hypothetical protein